jgi:HEPN domain-containing protein
MKGESIAWLDYAEENLDAAKALLEEEIYNPCLQNAQQAVEKALKAVLLAESKLVRKTHSIQDLVGLLADTGVDAHLSRDDCELLDTIYLPSKYPLGGVLPDFEPDQETCIKCLEIAERIVAFAKEIVEG